MSYRFMRMILMFDLPQVTGKDRREYRRFRKFLIKSGFIMLQESVYTKLALNHSTVRAVKNNVIKNKPPKGIVTLLTVTEKQYAGMDFILGEKNNDVIDSDERLIII